MCAPRLTLYVFGDVHAAHDPPSSLHSKVEPDSDEVKVNVAVLDERGAPGPLVIEVFGAVLSTVHVRVAGVASTLPAASLARTEKVCEPLARPE